MTTGKKKKSRVKSLLFQQITMVLSDIYNTKEEFLNLTALLRFRGADKEYWLLEK